jgi:putative ABC transport system substrate-binding protein
MAMRKLKILINAVLVTLLLNSCSNAPNNKVKKIGISLWIDNEDFQKNYQGFIDGLKIADYEEGENLELIVENPKGNIEEHRKIIEKFKQAKVDLIFTRGTSASLAAKEIAPDIPLIFSIVTFPVKSQILNSLDEASNKIAGTTNHVTIDQQYQIFTKLVPSLRSIAFIRSVNGQQNSLFQFEEFRDFLKDKNIVVLDFASDKLEDTLKLLEARHKDYDAIYGACDGIVQSGGEEKLAVLALNLSKPSFSCNRSSVAKGFLAALVSDYYAIGKDAGFKAAEMLKSGARKEIFSSDLATPILNINMETAAKLNIKIPKDLERTIDLVLYPIAQ